VATRVVVTEYELPRQLLAPHDVHGDSKGNIWYTPHRSPYIGKLDPRTGEVKEYRVPDTPGALPGTHRVWVDKDDIVWLSENWAHNLTRFDPKTEQFKRFEIEAGTHPHNLIVARDGGVWYAGNRNARIVRLDPNTGEAKTHMMPDSAARDPHTLIFDGKGNIWFSVQGGGYIGRLNMESGKIDLLKAGEGRTNPYGIVVDSKGQPWVNLFATNRIAVVDPATFTARNITVPRETARTRRIALTSGDVVWYVDYAGGYLGRIQPGSNEIKEWLTPGGAQSQPYALVADDQDRVWFAECARGATFLVGFDAKTEKFTHRTPVSSCIRHMFYHKPTRTIWFGTDANNIGRAILP
jgi:virginiamycin B lyase